MTYPDLAEALQARILVDQIAEKDAHTPCKRPEPNERRALETHIATLEKAVAKAEALGEQRRQEAQTAAKRVEALEVHIATLEEASRKPKPWVSSGARKPSWRPSGSKVSLPRSSR